MLPIFLAVGGLMVQAKMQREMGEYQQAVAKREAEERELQAKTEELARREELNAQLAANQVAMTMSGISGATPESIALTSAKRIASSEGAIGLSERLKQRQIIREGEAQAYAGRMQAASTLLSAGKLFIT